MTNYAIGGLVPAFYPLSFQFHKSMTETSDLLIWPILVLGVFNFLWVPLANYIGKRPVFIFTTLLLAVAYLWGALAKSFENLFWSNNLAAFAGSAREAVAASIVNDVFFLHERANLMSWYMNAISGGNTIGPLICGFVVSQSSWRVHKWQAFGLVVLNLLLVLLFVPEIRYDRSYIEPDLDSDANTGFSTSPNLEPREISPTLENPDVHEVSPRISDPEKGHSPPVVKSIHPADHQTITTNTAQLPKRTFWQTSRSGLVSSSTSTRSYSFYVLCRSSATQPSSSPSWASPSPSPGSSQSTFSTPSSSKPNPITLAPQSTV